MLGELAAWQDAEEQAKRATEQAERRTTRQSLGEMDRLVNSAYDSTETLTAVGLIAAGCYQHHREWRRRGRRGKAEQAAG